MTAYIHASLSTKIDGLTARESEVMQRMIAGEANKVIANNLDLSMRTVARLRGTIFEKLGCESAVEATKMAATLGMFENADAPTAMS